MKKAKYSKTLFSDSTLIDKDKWYYLTHATNGGIYSYNPVSDKYRRVRGFSGLQIWDVWSGDIAEYVIEEKGVRSAGLIVKELNDKSLKQVEDLIN